MDVLQPALGKFAFDPDEAKQMLDDAGWMPGADGIREKNGVRASINYLTTTGSPPRQKCGADHPGQPAGDRHRGQPDLPALLGGLFRPMGCMAATSR